MDRFKGTRRTVFGAHASVLLEQFRSLSRIEQKVVLRLIDRNEAAHFNE